MPSSEAPDYTLTEAEKAHFLEHGFIKVAKCFTSEQAAELTSNVWIRLGYSPTDKSTWTEERTNMPSHSHHLVETFAPKAWSVICQLLGGADRISPWMRHWSDAFIVNLGLPSFNPDDDLDLRGLKDWHNDGDFFVHFLDSPEQALLVIPLWSEIVPKGGGTVICTDGIKHIARHLYDHPEGVTPWMKSVNEPHEKEGTPYWNDLAANPSKTNSSTFHEMTGEVGDVVFMHPLMLHTASKNLLRKVRVITNPPVSLKEPFCFSRENKEEYSLVELKTLRDLGMPDGLGEWKITGPRREWISNRSRRQEAMKSREVERLNGV